MPNSAIVQVLIALVSVAFGAVLTAALQYFFWTRQHREELRSSEERETRRARARALERFRDVAGLLIEINRAGLSISNPQLNTATIIEQYRLERELLSAAAVVREEHPDQATRLAAFLRKITQASAASADTLHAELNAILVELRADVSVYDK